MALFLGRLTADTRSRDLEDLFAKYGRVTRLDIKRGTPPFSSITPTLSLTLTTTRSIRLMVILSGNLTSLRAVLTYNYSFLQSIN